MFETQADYISWLEQLIEELTTRSSPREEQDELLNLATQWRALFAHLPPTQQAIQPVIFPSQRLKPHGASCEKVL